MKTIFLFIFSSSILFAGSLVDAIKFGTKEGDVHLIANYTNSSPTMSGTKYQNNSYFVSSFGLYYNSAFYGYFRFYIGFRGVLPLIQSNKNSIYQGGNGDFSRDFSQGNRAMLANSYFEYFDGDTNIKAGRLNQKNDLINSDYDGILFQNKSLGFLLIDFIWIQQYGRVLPRELSNFTKFNTKYNGAYNLGFTFDILDLLKFKIYGFTSIDYYSFLGGKFVVDSDYINANVGVVGGLEHKNSQYNGKASFLANVDVGVNISIFYANLGYIKTGSSIGMGNLQKMGNTFSPFFYFSGDILNYERNVNLFYGKIGINSDIIKTYVVYGFNTFNKNNSLDSQKYSKGEVNVYLDWKTSDITNVIFYYLNTHGNRNGFPTLNQFGLALKLGF